MIDDDEIRYSRLCERIRQHCQRQGRYAPDEMSVEMLTRLGYTGEGFLYPPATLDQIRRAEERLGWPLPPLLRKLYTDIANGGFGPDLGLIGIENGHPYMFRDSLSQWLSTVTIEDTQRSTDWFIGGQITERLAECNETFDSFVLFPQDNPPDGLISIISIARYGHTFDLDLRTGCIYWITPHVDVDVEGRGMVAVMFALFVAYTLEELVEQWLKNTLLAWHWRPERDGMMCLGFLDQHGLSEIRWPHMDDDEETPPPPQEDTFTMDNTMAQTDIDALLDSDDWCWYQKQPPLEAE